MLNPGENHGYNGISLGSSLARNDSQPAAHWIMPISPIRVDDHEMISLGSGKVGYRHTAHSARVRTRTHALPHTHKQTNK